MAVPETNVSVLPVYGVDPDRAQDTDLVTVTRRRIEGRYPVDPFGADPQLRGRRELADKQDGVQGGDRETRFD